ncbi:hypothetical protein K2W90_01520 [Candidatus Babeliales bacterium]|nr:hypothetical protein [Candidatus Babeliales bacterium]
MNIHVFLVMFFGIFIQSVCVGSVTLRNWDKRYSATISIADQDHFIPSQKNIRCSFTQIQQGFTVLYRINEIGYRFVVTQDLISSLRDRGSCCFFLRRSNNDLCLSVNGQKRDIHGVLEIAGVPVLEEDDAGAQEQHAEVLHSIDHESVEQAALEEKWWDDYLNPDKEIKEEKTWWIIAYLPR